MLEPVAGPGGVRLLRLQGPDGAQVDFCEIGAHVCSWRDAGGRERLFLSPNAVSGLGKSIRGGIPVVFPQFSNRGPLPKHGFARGLPWRVGTAETFADGSTGLRLTLDANETTRKLWPFDFEATLDIALEAQALTLTLGVRNRGEAVFSFTAALHGYLAVSDLESAVVSGLAGRTYEDAASGGILRVQTERDLRFGAEVDRVYADVSGPLQLDSALGPLRIEAEGFRDVVVWNQGPELAASLADLGAGQHRGFVCVEAGRVCEPVLLAPGATWSGRQRLSG